MPRFAHFARLAPVALLLLLTAACSSTQERWAEVHVSGVSYSALYNLVMTTVDAEGFTVRHRQPQAGVIESEWVYGTSQRTVRGPSRRKVHALITREEEGEGFLVALRVAEEVIRKGGLLATHVRDSEDWEEYEDNYDDAEYLIAKVTALIQAASQARSEPSQPESPSP